MTTVKKGTTFRWNYADGNPLWVVKHNRGSGAWDCEIVEDEDFAGAQQVFTTEQIQTSLSWTANFNKALNGHNQWYASQKQGQIVHYHNGFKQFVRCEIVLGKNKEGKVCNQLKPIALVGEWRAYDLPHRSITGEIIDGYYGKYIRDGKTFEPNYSNIYEASKSLQRGFDPRTLPALDLSVPDMTPEEAQKTFLWKTIYDVRSLLGGEGLEGDLRAEYIANPLKTLTDAISVLQNALSKTESKFWKGHCSAEFVDKITKILYDCVYNPVPGNVTLQGPDDEGRWVLADARGRSVPLVNCYEDHYNAAILFGFDNCNDKNPNEQEAALEWLIEHNGNQIPCPRILQYFVDGGFKNEPITEDSFR